MLLFLDIETTGFDPENCELLELAAVRFDGKKIVAQFDELVRPENPDFVIPPVVQKLTGITPEMVAKKVPLADIRSKFLGEFLQPDDVIVGHNISFDTGFLRGKGFVFENTEIDTYPLSTIVLPEEESHALEVLSTRYNLPHENRHRALGDVIANLELWKLLQGMYLQDFSESLRAQYSEFLTKTPWPGKVFFLDFPQKESSNEQIAFSFPEKKVAVPPGVASTELQDKIAEALCAQKKVLWEVFLSFPENILISAASAAVHFHKKKGEKIGISFAPNAEKLALQLREKLTSDFPEVRSVLWRSPHFTLCQEKWSDFQKKDIFTTVEVTTALKVLRDTANGKYTAPNLKYEEWDIWQALSGNGCENCGEDCPARQFLPANLLAQNDVFFIPERALTDFPGENLVLCNAENLDEILTRFAQKSGSSWRVRSLAKHLPTDVSERFHFAFDMLGGFLREKSGEAPYSLDIPLDNDLLRDRHWHEFAESFTELSALLRQDFSQESALIDEIEIWEDFFSNQRSEQNSICFFRLDTKNEVRCFTSAITLDDALLKFIAEKKSILCCGAHFPKNAERVWRFVAPVQQVFACACLDLVPVEKWKDIRIYGAEGFSSEKNTPEEAVLWLEKLVSSNPGNTLVVAPSQKTLEVLEEGLLSAQLDDIRIISSRNGSTGKILQFLAKPGRKVLLGTPAFFDRVLPFQNCEFSLFFLQKFIFDAPGNTLLEARKKLFANAFLELLLPRSLGRFEREVFRLIETQKSAFSFFCFDPRLVQKNSYAEAYSAIISQNIIVTPAVYEELSEIPLR